MELMYFANFQPQQYAYFTRKPNQLEIESFSI